jgi:hypothetical protein
VTGLGVITSLMFCAISPSCAIFLFSINPRELYQVFNISDARS